MKGRSIRRRLLAGVAVVQIVAAVLATVLVVRHEQKRSYAMLDAELEEHAAMVTAVIEPPETAADKTILHRELLTLPRRDLYMLSDSAGGVIAASGDWRPPGPLPQAQQSFLDIRINGRRYRAIVERSFPLFNDEPDEVARLPKLVLIYASPEGRVEEHVWQVGWIAAGLGLAILLASLMATGWVVRTGLLPVTQLAESAARIDAAHWEWEPAGAQAAELVPLSVTLTRLVERLRAAFVHERQFSADAAHEMKTAVAIVKSTLQLTLERGGEAAEYRAGVERALDDTERMQGLVSGMLQLAKIEGLTGSIAGEHACADLLEALGTARRRLAPLLEARQMRMNLDAAEAVIRVRISPESLGIVLMNLLENAIQYSPDGSAIGVKVETRGEMCVLAIEDAGCGIGAAVLPHIFERFYRGDASRSRESGGAGLGLAIVRAIVDRAGGSVTAASSPAVGSIFTVTLPRADESA